MPRLRKLLKGIRLKFKPKKDNPVTKPNQYEEIDDNFTFLPAAGSKQENKNTTTINDDVTSASNPPNIHGNDDEDDDVRNDSTLAYENVEPHQLKTTLMNYEPKKQRRDDRQLAVNEIQNHNFHTSVDKNVSSNVTTTSSSLPSSSLSSSSQTSTASSNHHHHHHNNNVQENVYVNCAMTSQSTSHSSSNQTRDAVVTSSTNQNPGFRFQTVAETDGLEEAPKLSKKKNGKGDRPKHPTVPPPKLKKYKKTPHDVTVENHHQHQSPSQPSSPSSSPPPLSPKKGNNPNSSSTPASPSKGSNSNHQLTYIEVEFASPPSSKSKTSGGVNTKKNGGKSSPLPADPSSPVPSSTTYTDVVHEGGRLILIR